MSAFPGLTPRAIECRAFGAPEPHRAGLPLVPTLYLGTHLAAKLRFAIASNGGADSGNRRNCKAKLCTQARSQVKLGNEENRAPPVPSL